MRARIVWELGELSGIQEILQAEDLASGLTLLEAHHPEVAVLDLHLHKQLVFPILERIRARQLTTAPIIFTNASEGPLKDTCMRLGARAFLSKSSGFEDVLNTVSEILSSPDSLRPEHSVASQKPN